MSDSVGESFSYIDTLDKLLQGAPISPEALQQLLFAEQTISAKIQELNEDQ